MIAALPMITLVAAFTPATTGPALTNVDGELPRLEPTRCAFELPPDAVEGVNASCAYLVVPVRHSDLEGAVLRLAVLILKARSSNPQSAPLIVLHGGPGGSALDGLAYVFSSSPLREERDIVLF